MVKRVNVYRTDAESYRISNLSIFSLQSWWTNVSVHEFTLSWKLTKRSSAPCWDLMTSSVSFQRPTDLFECDVGDDEGWVGPRGPRDVVIHLKRHLYLISEHCLGSAYTVMVRVLTHFLRHGPRRCDRIVSKYLILSLWAPNLCQSLDVCVSVKSHQKGEE